MWHQLRGELMDGHEVYDELVQAIVTRGGKQTLDSKPQEVCDLLWKRLTKLGLYVGSAGTTVMSRLL
jgi:hypothetical protein